MEVFNMSRSNMAPILLIACMIVASVQPLQASIACPVMLYSGKVDQGTVSIRFMNRGKVPIRQLDLDCGPLQGQKARLFNCHTEAGVFYPGTSYALSFSYPGKVPRTIQVSLQTVLLPDGYIWTATQDQPCRPLKIVQR
jgi:hypothetical protein